MTADGADRSAGAPRFDVVVRGYDRRQVDEHVARLQRTVVRLRAELDRARGIGPVTPGSGSSRPGVPGPAPRPRPSPGPRPAGPSGAESPDVVTSFTGRMKTILHAAEQEAAEIRNRARLAAQAEEAKARQRLAELAEQHDGVMAELARLRGQLESLLAAPTMRLPRTTPATPSAPQTPSVRQEPSAVSLFEDVTSAAPRDGAGVGSKFAANDQLYEKAPADAASDSGVHNVEANPILIPAPASGAAPAPDVEATTVLSAPPAAGADGATEAVDGSAPAAGPVADAGPAASSNGAQQTPTSTADPAL